MDTQVRTKVVGIDVSKDSLAGCHMRDGKTQHLETENNKAGFKQLVKCCGTESLYVMEATGVYYLQLAYYLVKQGAQVVVVNPVIIKRYIQMHLSQRQERQERCSVDYALWPTDSSKAVAARGAGNGGMPTTGAGYRAAHQAKDHGH